MINSLFSILLTHTKYVTISNNRLKTKILYKKDELVSVLTTFVCKGHLINFNINGNLLTFNGFNISEFNT